MVGGLVAPVAGAAASWSEQWSGLPQGVHVTVYGKVAQAAVTQIVDLRKIVDQCNDANASIVSGSRRFRLVFVCSGARLGSLLTPTRSAGGHAGRLEGEAGAGRGQSHAHFGGPVQARPMRPTLLVLLCV